MHELNEEIGKLLAKAEQLGAEGNVDEAQKVLQEVEKVRTKKKDAEVSAQLQLIYRLDGNVPAHLNVMVCVGGIQELDACLQFPTAEAPCV